VFLSASQTAFISPVLRLIVTFKAIIADNISIPALAVRYIIECGRLLTTDGRSTCMVSHRVLGKGSVHSVGALVPAQLIESSIAENNISISALAISIVLRVLDVLSSI
jgi:hypothetical protein